MADEPTLLSEIMGARPVPFQVNGTTFYIRQPYDDEYDDSRFLYDRAYARAMAEPDVKALRDEPCSDSERELYQTLARLAERQAEGLAEDSAERKAKLEEAASLRELSSTRTAAQELAHDRALLVMERWLCLHLLCNGQGEPMFDPADEASLERWRRFSRKVKDAARPAIRQALKMVDDAPFA